MMKYFKIIIIVFSLLFSTISFGNKGTLFDQKMSFFNTNVNGPTILINSIQNANDKIFISNYFKKYGIKKLKKLTRQFNGDYTLETDNISFKINNELYLRKEFVLNGHTIDLNRIKNTRSLLKTVDRIVKENPLRRSFNIFDILIPKAYSGEWPDWATYALIAVAAAGAVGYAVTRDSDGGSGALAKDTISIKNEYIQVGVSEQAGGAINHLSTIGGMNFVNATDHGRLIQLSLYGNKDGSTWEGNPNEDKSWVWNPVQAGSKKGEGSTIQAIEVKDNEIYVKTTPRNWAGGELVEPMVYEQWVTLNENIVTVKYRATYSGAESHASVTQEMPAIFLDSSLSTLVYQNGHGQLVSQVPTFGKKGESPNKNAIVSNHWAAYTKDNSGVGIKFPSASEITYYRLTGDKGTSYLSPIVNFAIASGFSKEWTIYLTIGTVKEIQERFNK